MTITLTVAGRIASVDATAHVVAGNTYPVALSLDSEWTGSLYLRVRFGSLYYDIPFASTDASVDVQMPVGYPEVGVGVFSEALEICSCEARIRLLRSILEAGEQVVEFDSDLYDQWAGEVSELLCDDAFDSTSDRPVKNSVITAWKDTVPLDSALVHKTGNETINGNKTFTARMFVREPSIPSIHVVSETAYTATGWKGLVGFFDQKDGANSEAAGIYTSVASGEVNLGLRVHKPNRSGQFDTIIRSYDDHQIIITTPYYPTDSGGNPQPIGANALITSGNIAVDPRIVHTSGIETIAGEKTLLTAPVVSASESGIIFLSDRSESSNQRITTLKFADVTNPRNDPLSQFAVGRTAQFNYVISYLKKGNTNHSVTFRAHADHMDIAVTPYYPVDGSGNPQALPSDTLMASGNVAVDPRIVHTTGNETVAGNKTFNGITFIDNPRFKRSNQTLHGNGEWVKFYEFLPVSYGGLAVIRAFQTYYIYAWVGAEIRIRQGTPTSNPDGKFYNMNSVVGKLAKRVSDGVVEVWLQNTTTNNLGVLTEITVETGGSMKLASAVSQTAPAVGDTYSTVVDIANS